MTALRRIAMRVRGDETEPLRARLLELSPGGFEERDVGGGAVELAVYAGGPVLGDVEAGVVGGLVSVPFAIVSGGVLCVVAAGAFAVFVPRLTRYVAGGVRAAPAP